MLLVTLVASAAFTVIAQRRQRQLGMLAAIGATPSRIKLVMLADGAAVGILASVLGAVVGLGAWVLSSGAIESAAGHEIAPSNVPWWIVAATLAPRRAVVACGLLVAGPYGVTSPGHVGDIGPAAAASPGPTVRLARPPAPRRRPDRPGPRRQPGSGLGELPDGARRHRGIDDRARVPRASGSAHRWRCSAAVRHWRRGLRCVTSAAIRPAPVRRWQPSRSVLAIAVTIVVVAAAAEDGAAEGNLASSQLLIRVGDSELETPEIEAGELDSMRAAVDDIASRHGETLVVPLQVAVDPTESMTAGLHTARPTVFIGWKVDDNTYRDAGAAYVATPELLAYLGIDPASVEPDTVLLSSEPHDELYFVNVAVPDDGRDPLTGVQRITAPAYSAVPRSMITQRSLDTNGWRSLTAGWLLEADRPFTATELHERSRRRGDSRVDGRIAR